MRVAIIGAGAIGLSIGWRLASRGCEVIAFDRGAAGQGATHAAAGMLAAGIETEPGELALHALNRESQAMWPAFAAELRDTTGIDVGLRREGTLAIAHTRDEAARLRATFEFQRAHGITQDWITPAAARAREPHLHGAVAGAVFSPEDHQVDNRALAQALVAAFRKAGGDLRERTEAAPALEGSRVTGVVAGGEHHRVDMVVLAAGAWSGEIGGLPSRLSVRPVKGQMLALSMDPKAPLLRHVVWTPKAYLVPRASGRLIIGATTEERGFDTDMTAGGVFALLDAAWRAFPAIEDLPIAEMWAGFRPGTRDDAPLLGIGALPGLVMATGHHRNGILLTPATASHIASCILTGVVPDALKPFHPDRFERHAPEGSVVRQAGGMRAA